MFFYLSKTIGFFLVPSNVFCFLAVLGLLLSRTTHARLGGKISSLAIVTLVFLAFSPLGNWLLLPLEDRFAQPPIDKSDLAPYGIIVLGGSIDTIVTKRRGSIALKNSAERLVEAVKLARRFPKARILFSGGSGLIVYESMREADAAQKLFSQMGIAPERLIFERNSRNTWQNARYTKDLLKSNSAKQWLLVTSAYHMARSVGCFEQVGMNVIAWPVDYRTRGNDDVYRFFDRASDGWQRVDISVREWIGLVAYWMTGRTSRLFPQ